MEAMMRRLIELGWEFSIRYESSKFSITIWRPDWSKTPSTTSRPCPSGNGATLLEALLNLTTKTRLEFPMQGKGDDK